MAEVIEENINEALFAFIKKSPCAYLAVDSIRQILLEHNFTELSEKDEWNLENGQNYFVIRNESALITFHMPGKNTAYMPEKEDIKAFYMAASHVDSPSFKIKESPEIKVENYVKLNVEKYGGMILSTWLDRRLSAAGRVVVQESEKLQSKLVDLERDLFVIPNLAIHMNGEINKGFEYNAQTDMTPLFAEEGTLRKLIADKMKLDEEDILGMDLYLYNSEEGKVFGANGEFIAAPRLDDLQCSYGLLQGFLKAVAREEKEENGICQLAAFFDNEEVGSSTIQGANSTFLEDVLVRIKENFEMTNSRYQRALANSFMISADNAHGLHPNHPEKADLTNKPVLNGGIVIKYHGSQKYTTDAYSGAFIKQLCQKTGVPFQTFANRSDIAGGSTLGNILTSHVSVNSVDIGLAQLAMHSALETAGARDTEYLIKVMQEYFSL